jgi:fructose-bisphosphate aldolase, class II
LRQCVAAGAHKINVNRLVLDNYYEHLESSVGRMPQTRPMEEGVEKVVRQTMEWMEICGSADEAVGKSMS